MSAARQEILDRFYWSRGPCCAGCDWWHSHNAVAGDCTKSAPVSGERRAAMIDVHPIGWALDPGHVVTRREHVCGDFKDEFDWNSLPLPYRKRIGQIK